MEPLLGGKLANGLPQKAVDIIKEADRALSPAAWAMKWLYDQPEVTVVLSGMSNEEALEDNLTTAADAKANSLTEKNKGMYEQVLSVLRESYKVPCTGCNYCMPCPTGVNIPACFAAYNASFAMGYVAGITQYMTSASLNNPNNTSGASNCKKCGKCEKQCPQHIGIMSELEKVSKKMEPFWIRPILKIARRVMSGPKLKTT
jgi:predicted aldo/keto reductase-like oxidoreductase